MKLLGRCLVLFVIALPVFATCALLIISSGEAAAEEFVDALAAKLDAVFG